ncbi:MAG: hypothetical protein C4532_08285 [Candidatus Abyssobacteria bacterium SURF_17]|uniref:Uncharacterized protein n=1 Tax=Candidatus Abyssobacteria bacterium SURF_17 TaxID=2093361 RepID=A0A419F040_9BACT|nr:MAG: hypothetical protein C4532_08285 [Candidatus Abyssubacteria bacterium SURF_17]
MGRRQAKHIWRVLLVKRDLYRVGDKEIPGTEYLFSGKRRKGAPYMFLENRGKRPGLSECSCLVNKDAAGKCRTVDHFLYLKRLRHFRHSIDFALMIA